MKNGVIYVCHGRRYCQEVLISVESVKRFNPDLHITVFSDVNPQSDLVDSFQKISPTSDRTKVSYMYESPYDNTLFLDTDVVVVRDINEIFGILDKYDLAIAHDLARKRGKYSTLMPEYKEIPYVFSEVNTGIIVFKKNERVQELFELWKQYYKKYYGVCPYDQPSFRISLWKGKTNVYILPIEYNIRSQANREKQVRFHHEFGEEHLEPRMYHMHHGGQDLDDAIEKSKKLAQSY